MQRLVVADLFRLLLPDITAALIHEVEARTCPESWKRARSAGPVAFDPSEPLAEVAQTSEPRIQKPESTLITIIATLVSNAEDKSAT